jgi:CheY-like chemotaxis protein
VEIWLPVAEPASAGLLIAPPKAGRSVGRVLLVDDEAEVRVMLASFLKGAGFSVRAVCEGEAALALLAAGEPFDVLVTDFAMPGLDGMELVAQARRIRPDLPVLVVSGYSESERLEAAGSQVRVLRKPFRRQALVQEVSALVESGTRPSHAGQD